MTDHEILVVARKIRMDLTATQAKLTELLRMAASLEPETDARVCPECGLRAGSLPQGATLADHRWTTHDVETGDALTGLVVKHDSLTGKAG